MLRRSWRNIAHALKDHDTSDNRAATSQSGSKFREGSPYQWKGVTMRKILKAVAAAAVLTGVMLGSSGCITIDLGAPAAVKAE
jgi:hypothetical protein